MFGIATGHIGRSIIPITHLVSTSLISFFVETRCKKKENSPRRASVPEMNTHCGMGHFELVALENLARTYSVSARIVPSAQSLEDHLT